MLFEEALEQMEPQKLVDIILLDKWGIQTIKCGNLSHLSKSLYTKILFSIKIARCKNEAECTGVRL